MIVNQTLQDIIEKLETRDVFEIAKKFGVKIIYESWHPATIGEFDRRAKTICVNLRALEESKNSKELKQIIIAHELGHFFARDLNLDKNDEENFARMFAKDLLSPESE